MFGVQALRLLGFKAEASEPHTRHIFNDRHFKANGSRCHMQSTIITIPKPKSPNPER